MLKAHGVMLGGLTSEAGMYRERPVGVVDSESGEIIHFGTLPKYVPDLMNQLFAWLPVESMICQRQHEYYKTINYCNAVCDSTKFIEFMLDTVISALEEAIDSV